MRRSIVFGALIAIGVWLAQGAIIFIDTILGLGLTIPPLVRVAIAIGAGVGAFMVHRESVTVNVWKPLGYRIRQNPRVQPKLITAVAILVFASLAMWSFLR